MKRFRNQDKVHPLVIKEDSTEQRNISSPEDLQPALQNVAQPNVAAARKKGIGSRIVRGIRAAGRNIRRFFKPKKIVPSEELSGVNDVLSTNDRERAPWTTTEDNHQTPTTQPSHESFNSDIKGKSCEVMPKTSAIEDQPHTVIPSTIDTTTMNPSPPVPSNNIKKDWLHAVVPNTGAIMDQSHTGMPDTTTSHDSLTSLSSYSAKEDSSCAVVTNTCVKDQSCPVVSNTYIMKDQFRPIFNTIGVNKSAFWIPYKTYTTTDHNPATPVPSNNIQEGLVMHSGPQRHRSHTVFNTVALKNKSAFWTPYTTDTTKNHRPSPPVPSTNAKKDWSCRVVHNTSAAKSLLRSVLLNNIARRNRSSTVLPSNTDTIKNQKSSIPVPSKSDKKSPSLTVVTKTRKDRSCTVAPNNGAMKNQSRTVLLNTIVKKDRSSKVLPSKTYIIKKHESSIPVPVKKGRSPTLVTKTGAMKELSCTVVPTNSVMKNQSRTVFLNTVAKKDRSCKVLPSKTYIIKKHESSIPVPVKKDRSPTVVPNNSAMKSTEDRSPAMLPNAGAMLDRSPSVLPIAGAMENQSSSVGSIPPGIMMDQSPTMPPKTNVIWDKSYSLAMEKGFTFHKILGEGAFGKVMLASHPATSMILAVKIIEKKNYLYPEDRLLKEVRNNLFITHLYDSFQSKDQHVLVMEYLSGGDLLQLINHSAPLPEDTLRNLTADIICGLKFLHSKNIVHRDIKPDNILLDDDGRAKIADLGVSKSGVSEQKKIRGLAGTVPYMAPEVLQKIPYYTLADYFSLGVIVYQMAVRKHPFWTGQKIPEEMLRAVRFKKVYIPLRLNRYLRDLIERLLCVQQEIRKIQVRDLRSHPFFKNFDWAKIEKRPPIPKIDFGSGN